MDFLLDTPTARHLYHEHAEHLPIIDYHCHLSPQLIAEDHQFKTITELWLSGDHYKWRAMRANGVDERYITGSASDWEKFEKWAQTVPYTMRNPLYHWTHLELATAFGIHEALRPESARRIYDECNAQLARPEMSARGLMARYNVEVVCTTDDPADTLQYHEQLRRNGFAIKVLPAWRPDRAMAVGRADEYGRYIERLGESARVEIRDYDGLIEALRRRADYFHAHGCRLADHGLERFPCCEASGAEVRALYARVLGGETLAPIEVEQVQTAMLIDLCKINYAHDWAQQFHFGPMRNVNSVMMERIGPDTGFDTIGDYRAAQAVAHALDSLNSCGALARTILYNLNPADNTWVAAMAGCFQDGSIPGKMQFGAAWWFNDQLYGMEAQLNALSMQGLLSRFVGMLTDSRSFLSYPRHEYFRRLLCRLLGRDVEQGLLPESEMPRIEAMVRDICYDNAKNYFKF